MPARILPGDYEAPTLLVVEPVPQGLGRPKYRLHFDGGTTIECEIVPSALGAIAEAQRDAGGGIGR